MGKNGNIFPKISNETRAPTLPTSIEHILGIPSQSNKARTRNKRIQRGKEGVKLSLFSDDMII
jgi:hypothetical protein